MAKTLKILDLIQIQFKNLKKTKIYIYRFPYFCKSFIFKI